MWLERFSDDEAREDKLESNRVRKPFDIHVSLELGKFRWAWWLWPRLIMDVDVEFKVLELTVSQRLDVFVVGFLGLSLPH